MCTTICSGRRSACTARGTSRAAAPGARACRRPRGVSTTSSALSAVLGARSRLLLGGRHTHGNPNSQVGRECQVLREESTSTLQPLICHWAPLLRCGWGHENIPYAPTSPHCPMRSSHLKVFKVDSLESKEVCKNRSFPLR